MFLIVGLGNPGPQYAFTRHNIGFMCVDYLVESLGGSGKWTSAHKALLQDLRWEDQRALFVKPQTFMNKSGESVIPIMQFHKIDPSQVLVIHDDIDQVFGKMKLQKSRGHGGHNGVRHISEQLGHSDYARLKLGVGRPPHPQMEVADYVLQKFSQEENATIPEFLNRAGDAVEAFVFHGLEKAATMFNK